MKKFFALLVVSFSVIQGFSQTFMHGAGVNVFVSKVSGADASVYGGFSYSPRVTFLETESLSLSAGIPLSIAVAGSYNYNYNSYYGSEEENTLRLLINAPVMVDLNFGAGSTKENESRFGFFVGGGFGINYGHFLVPGSDGYGDTYSVRKTSTTYGPAANAGFRIAVGQNFHNIETKLSFMKGINDYKASIFGVNVSFNF